MPPTQAHSNAYSPTHSLIHESCFAFRVFFSSRLDDSLLVCLCMSVCTCLLFHVSLYPPLPLLSPFPTISVIAQPCVSVFLSVSVSVGLSVCLYLLPPVCLSLTPCLSFQPSFPGWWYLCLSRQSDDMEFLSHAYVFRHLIVPLADAAGTCCGGKWSSWTLRIFQGLVEVEGSVQVTGVLEATMTFRIAFFSTSHVMLGRERCFCSLSLSFLICKMGPGLPSKVVSVIWCKTVC